MRKITSLLFGCLLLLASKVYAQNQQAHVLAEADSLYNIKAYQVAAKKYALYLGDTSTNTLAWDRAGFSNQSAGNYDEAMRDYNKSLANKPAPYINGSVNAHMAMLLSVQNETGKAVQYLTTAVRYGYNALPDMDTLADFANLRHSAGYDSIKKSINEIIYPCLAAPHAHDFDFWIGEWDVYVTGTHSLVGHSVIQSISGGCGLLENWSSTQANIGKSINYYDPAEGKWRQDWVGSGQGISHYFNGEYKDGAMNFIYESTNSSGVKTKGNFRFYNIDKNTVRQYLELSTDDGKTYQPSYDLTYVRKK